MKRFSPFRFAAAVVGPARGSGSDLNESAIRRPALITRLVDPEWVIFFGLLLGPSLFCVLVGDSDRAAFFARLALYLGFLKWLGWAVLTRGVLAARSGLVFPAELLIGLTLVVLWFYVRTVVGWIVPGSFSIRELGVAAWLIAIGQIVGGVTWAVGALRRTDVDRSRAFRGLAPPVLLLLPFVVTLTLTLWSVSKEVFVPSQDGWFHSFIARVYLNDGMLYPHFNGHDAIFYVSGFGAMNAVAAAASGLTVVQTHNLQHILWIVTGFYLVTTTVASVSGRTLAWLHVMPPLFLTAYPAHNLPPDVFWTHTPQQTASALLVAIPLLSLVLPVDRRVAFYRALAVQAFLSLIILALSPVSAFFLPLSCGLALAVNAVRARQAFAVAPLKVAAAQAAFTLLAAALVFGCDRYYSTLILNPADASYMKGAHFGGNSSTSHRLFSFSTARAVAAAMSIKPMALLPDPEHQPHEPGRYLPWLALGLVFSAGVVTGRRSSAPISAARQLAITATVALAAMFAVKFGASFMSGGITNASLDALLLQSYLIFMGRRIELGLLFLTCIAAGVALRVGPQSGVARVVSTASLSAAAIVVLAWWAPQSKALLDPRTTLLVPRNVGFAGKITRDDIDLVKWMTRNIPPEKGLIGLTSTPQRSSVGDSKFLFPIGSAQALSLYGNQYNFCFQVFDPGRRFGYDDYIARVVNHFDADWCLANGIRYFHVPSGEIYPNHGLTRAREIGLLDPIRVTASSGLYAVRPLPWTPLVIPGPTTPAASNQVSWRADGTAVAQGGDPFVEFALDRPEFVHAIRFKYLLTGPTHTASSQLFWKTGDQTFVEHERTIRLPLATTATEQTLTILVHDTLDRFRFDPDRQPCTFRIRDLELLVKPPDTVARPTRGQPAK